ncbi:MAG: hypothetical protein NVS3B21_25370 [Acidimicrobiales bacterium]
MGEKLDRNRRQVFSRRRVRTIGLLAAAGALAFGVEARAFAAPADYNGTQHLLHVGPNPGTCTTIPAPESGVVNVHYNLVQQDQRVNISVHDALPNTTYEVDNRCHNPIGFLTTNSDGTGTAQIDLPPVLHGIFYIDLSVPGGGTGAGGYGDTFIAGPFTLP